MSFQRTHVTRPANALLRHVCTGCGGCCQGVRVPVYNDAERDKVLAAAEALGVQAPIEGGGLRMVQGRCVFLDDAMRCRIHATLGAEHKPIPCRQFPLIALAAGDEVRIGVDPASYGAWRSWRDGAPLPDGPVVASSPPAPGGQEGVERAIVALCEDPDASVPGLIAVLTREPAPRGVVPPGFAARWAQRLGDVDLGAFLAHDAVGPNLRRGLAPVAAASRTWAGQAPAWPGLRPEDDAWAVEAIRRVIFLRLMPEVPNVSAAALLLLGGVVAAAWTDPDPERFHPALTAWIRAMRFPTFWRELAGDRDTMVWLGTGRRPSSA